MEEALGNERGLLSALRVKDLKTGSVRDLEVSGLFFAIGHEPASAFLGGQARPDIDFQGLCGSLYFVSVNTTPKSLQDHIQSCVCALPKAIALFPLQELHIYSDAGV